MKKYLFIVLAAVISLFSSCAEDDAAIGLSGLKGSQSYVALPVEGGSTDITIESVSYTHLDVYKRQTERCPLIPTIPLSVANFKKSASNSLYSGAITKQMFMRERSSFCLLYTSR